MRYRRFKLISTVLSILLGAILLVVSLFAYQLGMDNNPTPGRLRKVMALVGIFFLLAPLLALGVSRLEDKLHLGRKLSAKWHSLMARLPLHDPEVGTKTSVGRFFHSNDLFWAAVGVILVFIVSLWYMTSGTLTRFTPYSNYFDLEADGFLAGKTSLAVEPPAELAQLSDPYDWKSREGIHYIWDASYYQGKYYIYWGPVPALVASIAKAIHPGVVEDQYLLLFFTTGLSIFLALILGALRKKYFPSVPAWLLSIFILVGGLSTPVFWLINRPHVYETAIASCQFFYIMGLYGLIKGLTADRKAWGWFLLAGFGLGAAVASRMTVMFSVFFVVGVTLFVLIKKWLKQRSTWESILCLFIPLVIFACGLAWFNYTRFGSITESGLRFQLTGEALPEDFRQLFSLRYVIPNIYLTLFQPYQFDSHAFPFFFATADNSWTAIIHLPEHYYYAEQITGILCSIPFFWMLILPLVGILKKGWLWVKEAPVTPARYGKPTLPTSIWWLLFGSFLVGFIVNMLYVFATMRYLADIVPQLVIITSLLIMRILERTSVTKAERTLVLVLVVFFALFTITISLLINFSSWDERFSDNNPALFNQIVNIFQK